VFRTSCSTTLCKRLHSTFFCPLFAFYHHQIMPLRAHVCYFFFIMLTFFFSTRTFSLSAFTIQLVPPPLLAQDLLCQWLLCQRDSTHDVAYFKPWFPFDDNNDDDDSIIVRCSFPCVIIRALCSLRQLGYRLYILMWDAMIFIILSCASAPHRFQDYSRVLVYYSPKGKLPKP
jgi:hypothetical protein